jgi:CheY-like chemotaxis protein
MPDGECLPTGGEGVKAAQEKPYPITKAVMEMLHRNGVARADYAATIAEVIHLNPVSARRRLNDDSGWTYDDIKRLAERFGDEALAIVGSAFQGTTPLQGRVEIGDISLPCSFWVDAQFQGRDLVGPMVALEPLTDAEPWSIVPIDQRGDRSAHALHALVVNFQRGRRRVAVIDDEPAVSDGLAALLRLKGMDAKPFSSAEQFLAAHREHAFDAFIVDWLLGSGDTRELLTQIRASSHHAPLLVLTGRIGTENVRERDVDAAVHAVGGELMEKPAKILKVMRYLQRGFAQAGA